MNTELIQLITGVNLMEVTQNTVLIGAAIIAIIIFFMRTQAQKPVVNPPSRVSKLKTGQPYSETLDFAVEVAEEQRVEEEQCRLLKGALSKRLANPEKKKATLELMDKVKSDTAGGQG